MHSQTAGWPLDLVPLQHLVPGESARVAHLVGSVQQLHRLQELGLREGETVEMVRSGCPCILRFGGAKYCFRDADMCQVLVQRNQLSPRGAMAS